jgi:hypothetical protein
LRVRTRTEEKPEKMEVPMDLQAVVGDELVVDSLRQGAPPRKGEVIEVLGEGDRTHYRVRWDDGRESVFFPSSTSHIVHTKRP